MNELLSKLPDLKQDINLTKDTLNKLYETLQNENVHVNSDNISSEFTCTPITFLGKYPQNLSIPSTTFIDPKIYNFLGNSSGFYQQFHVFIAKRRFTIHIYLPSGNSNSRDDNVVEFFQDCIRKIYLWLRFITPHIRNRCSLKTTFFLLFTHFKKNLPEHNEPFTFKHVNSALTTSCIPESSVYIFRYEEWFKVLIHESFHCFGLDFSHYDNSEVEAKIVKTFKVVNNNGVRVYEAYCEIWADVLNIVFVSFSNTKDKRCFMKVFENLLNKELSFTAFQCSKILNHIGISYDDLIDIKCKTIKYKETANIISYYFLKFIIFLNLRKFDSWCKKHHTRLFRFEKKNMEKFVDFIIQHSNTSPLRTSLQRMKLFHKRAKLSPFAVNTMQMTIVK